LEGGGVGIIDIFFSSFFLVNPRGPCIYQIIFDPSGGGGAGEASHNPSGDRNPSSVADMGNDFSGLVYLTGEFTHVGIAPEFIGSKSSGHNKKIKISCFLGHNKKKNYGI